MHTPIRSGRHMQRPSLATLGPLPQQRRRRMRRLHQVGCFIDRSIDRRTGSGRHWVVCITYSSHALQHITHPSTGMAGVSASAQPQQLPLAFPCLAAIPVPPRASEEKGAPGGATYEDIFLLSRTEVQREVVQSALCPDDPEPRRRSARSRRQRQPAAPEPEEQGQRPRPRRGNEGAAAVAKVELPARQETPNGGPQQGLSPAFGPQQALSLLPWSQEGPVPVLAPAVIEELEGLFQD